MPCLDVADGASSRVKRQDDSKKDDSFENEICKDKDAGEWFRLVAGEGDNCRDVIQCTSSGLQAIRCPAGLYFDIEKQTCDWKGAVNNCKLNNKERKVTPLIYTEEPLCQDGQLACGDGSCIERGLFCNGEKDCGDGSDENVCGKKMNWTPNILISSTSHLAGADQKTPLLASNPTIANLSRHGQ